jgi:hypothetical protein
LRFTATIRLALLLIAAISSAEVIDRIAVSVADRVITTSDIEREIRLAAFQDGVAPVFTPASRRAAAERLVQQRLILREIENSRYPAPSPADVEPKLAEFIAQHFPSGEQYRAALQAAGITEQDFKDFLLWQQTLLVFVDIRFRPGIQVSDAEIQDYFEKTVAPLARQATGKEPKLDDYRAEIEQHLAGEKVNAEMDRWLTSARRRAEIRFHDEVFQ